MTPKSEASSKNYTNVGFRGLTSSDECKCLTVAEALVLIVLPLFFSIVKVVSLHDYIAYFILRLESIG